jgi:hypothetical protein
VPSTDIVPAWGHLLSRIATVPSAWSANSTQLPSASL